MPGRDTTLWAQNLLSILQVCKCISNVHIKESRSCSYCTAQSDRSQGAILFILVTKIIRQPGTHVLKIRSGAKLGEKCSSRVRLKAIWELLWTLTQMPRNEQVWLLQLPTYFPVQDAIPRTLSWSLLACASLRVQIQLQGATDLRLSACIVSACQDQPSEQQAECPECFRCPISLECMSRPVMLLKLAETRPQQFSPVADIQVDRRERSTLASHAFMSLVVAAF